MRCALLLCFCVTFTALAQQNTVFEDRPSLVLSNDKFELTVLSEGGAMAQIVLADDKDKTNPLWNPYWIARQAGLNPPASFGRGPKAGRAGVRPGANHERAPGQAVHPGAPPPPGDRAE